MYFDMRPKTDARDLFGVDYLLHLLTDAIKDKKVRMVVIKGLRRTGKTSLLNVALKESKMDYIKIDVREAPYYDKTEFFEFLIEKLEEKYNKIKKMFSGSELKFFYKDIGAGLKIKGGKRVSFFEKLDAKLKKGGKQIILAFDEIQLLEKTEFDQVLASIYDNYGQIKTDYAIVLGSVQGPAKRELLLTKSLRANKKQLKKNYEFIELR